jgi:hypothetical protein
MLLQPQFCGSLYIFTSSTSSAYQTISALVVALRRADSLYLWFHRDARCLIEGVSFTIFYMNSRIHMSFKVFLINTCSIVVLLLITVVSRGVQARDLIDFNLDVISDKQGDEAKQDAFDQAIEKASIKLTEQLLGVEKAQRSWSNLRSRILKNSTRFIVFMKATPPVQSGGHTQITVTMKLSPDNLEALLREEGALTTGTLRILPLVTVGDGKGNLYAWWATSPETAQASQSHSAAIAEEFKKFTTLLAAKMKSKSVFVIDPTSASFRANVPMAYRSMQLSREDQSLLAQYFKADVVLSGRIEGGRLRSENSDLKLRYDLQLWQAKAGRSIAEVQRIENLASDQPKVILGQIEVATPKVAEELSARLAEAVTAGNLNLNVVRVAVTGSMSYRQQAEFKRQLSQLKDVKVLKERLFEPGRVTFEAETPVTGRELAQLVQKTQFPLYQVAVDGAQEDSLALTVRALSSSLAQ